MSEYFYKFLETFQNIRTLFLIIWKLSRISENFPECLEKISECLETFQIFQKFSDSPETLKMSIYSQFWKLSRVSGKLSIGSGNFLGCSETLQGVQKLCWLSRNFPKIAAFSHIFYIHTQKLSGWQKLTSSNPWMLRRFFWLWVSGPLVSVILVSALLISVLLVSTILFSAPFESVLHPLLPQWP